MPDRNPSDSEEQPVSTPRSQHGESRPIGKGPSGQSQTDDQDNLYNNVSNLGEGDDEPPKGKAPEARPERGQA